MMMGPAPMIRMLWRSLLLGMELASSRFLFGGIAVAGVGLDALDHQVHEMLEQQLQVMRAGTRFGMPLKAERRAVRACDALQRTVEQRAVRGPQVARQRRFVHRETMVLARDEDPAGVDLEHRMIGAVMPEFHFHGLGAARQPEQLMTQTDAEQRDIGLQELLDGSDGVVAGLGIAGTVT